MEFSQIYSLIYSQIILFSVLYDLKLAALGRQTHSKKIFAQNKYFFLDEKFFPLRENYKSVYVWGKGGGGGRGGKNENTGNTGIVSQLTIN